MRFMYKLMQFMSGRYGVDRLFYFILGISTTLSFTNLFVRSVIIQIIVYALTFIGIYRVFSRNISLRAKENQVLTGWIDKIIKWRDTRRKRAADTTHIYKKCPKCKAILRLPRRVGKHKTVCPKCGNEFRVRVRK